MFLVKESGNAKIGLISATYAPIAQTCPFSCPFRNGNGCYAEGGNVGLHMRRLERETEGLNGDTLAMLEADEITHGAAHVPEGRPLRLHVSGDATTEFRARQLSSAARYWRGPVYSYTHAWRDVPRAAWGNVSILASCESPAAAAAAHERGYAAAVVTRPHASAKAYSTPEGIRMIPCPSQTRGVLCSDCKLCFRADKLHAMKAAIAFEVHGQSKKRALNVLQ